jgi:hypothetical protein
MSSTGWDCGRVGNRDESDHSSSAPSCSGNGAGDRYDGMGETLQDFLSRHRAAAWDCQSRGRTCCAQLHQEIIRDLERMTVPAATRPQIRARILAMEGRHETNAGS